MRIFTIGEGLRQAILQYLPAGSNAEAKVQLIPVWNKAPGNNIEKSTRNFLSEWGLTGKHIILYSGNIGLTHPLEYLVELAKRLTMHPEWQVVIVGNGTKKMQLQEQATGLNNIIFKDPVPFADLSQLLSVASWGYVTLDTGATNSSVPSKTFNLLAAGIPVLAMVNSRSEIARLLDTYHAGIYFKEEEIDTIVNNILSVSGEEHKMFSVNAIKCSKDFTSQLAYQFIDNWITDHVPTHH